MKQRPAPLFEDDDIVRFMSKSVAFGRGGSSPPTATTFLRAFILVDLLVKT